MVKTVVLYKEPADKEAFESYYFANHVPLVHKIPGLVKFEVSKSVGKAPYYLMAELYFNSFDDMKAGLGSDEGKATNADLPNFVSDLSIVSFFSAEVK
jgi:uncharacterized protein (TIGR02118 family)